MYRCKGRNIQKGQIAARTHCGADLSLLVAKIKADEKVHVIKCPKCGNKGKVLKVP